LAGLCGCAHDPGPPPVIDLAAMPCTAAISTADAAPLVLKPKDATQVETVLDSKSQCVDQAGRGRSLYKVFALPRSDAPYMVMVSANPWGNTILAPQLEFLTGGKTTRTTTRADFTFRGESLSAVLRGHAGEDYLVVMTDRDAFGSSVSRITERVDPTVVPAYPYYFVMYNGSGKTTDLHLSPAGAVMVTIAPLTAN
jgi:hypothetical protein